MYKIYIDATQRYEKAVKLFKDDVLVEEMVGDINITSELQDLLDKNRLTIEDINTFESNPGPGSFTGLKISSTIANVLNWATGKKKTDELSYPNYGREPNITLKPTTNC